MTTRAIILAAVLLAAIHPAHAADQCAIPAGGPAPRADFSGRVAAVIDGDTFDMETGGKRVRIRVYGIDAPEHVNTAGLLARAALERLAEHAEVSCVALDRDKYGRTVAACRIAGGPDIALAQLATGNAATYRRYLTDPRYRAAYIAAETQARAAHCGIWR